MDESKILNPFQKKIYLECLAKGKGGLSLPMGSGKTLLSMVIGLAQSKQDELILVVAAKSLIASWESENVKFFGSRVKCEVLHKSRIKNTTIWKPKPDTKIIITTPETIAGVYRDYNIRESIVSYSLDRSKRPAVSVKYYTSPKAPMLNHSSGFGLLYSLKWGAVIIDEIQQYTNITTLTCQGLISIISDHRWLLSGTIVEEPKPERILGYYRILNHSGTPRCLPDMKNYIRGKPMVNIRNDSIETFEGLGTSMISRGTNETFVPPKINQEIVSHPLSYGECQIYKMMKTVMMEVSRKSKELKHSNPRKARKFSTYKLAMLTYLRQSLICPFIPLASVAVDMCDFKKKSDLSSIFISELERQSLGGWLNNVEAVRTTRIDQIIQKVNQYSKERIVMFTCFRTCLNVVRHYMPTNRPILRLESEMSIEKRGEVIKEFEKTKNGVLLLTYALGANGLNLQCSNTVFLTDFWWNSSKTEQAVARVLRFGQKSKVVNIIYFTSNTALESIIFDKQKSKVDIIKELMVGKVTTKIKSFSTDEIIKIISLEDNNTLLKSIYF